MLPKYIYITCTMYIYVIQPFKYTDKNTRLVELCCHSSQKFNYASIGIIGAPIEGISFMPHSTEFLWCTTPRKPLIRPHDSERHKCIQSAVEIPRVGNIFFWNLLNQTEIRSYLPFSDRLGTANRSPFGSKSIRKW